MNRYFLTAVLACLLISGVAQAAGLENAPWPVVFGNGQGTADV